MLGEGWGARLQPRFSHGLFFIKISVEAKINAMASGVKQEVETTACLLADMKRKFKA